MAFDFNKVIRNDKRKDIINNAHTSASIYLIYEYINKHAEDVYIKAISDNRSITFNDIKNINGNLEIGKLVGDTEKDNDYCIFMNNGEIFQSFIDTCKLAGIKKILNPVWMLNDLDKCRNVTLSISDIDFTSLTIKGLDLERFKNVKAERVDFVSLKFLKQGNININCSKGFRMSGVYGMRDLSFIKYAPVVSLLCYHGKSKYSDDRYDIPSTCNLKGLPDSVTQFQLRFGNECLKYSKFSTKYLPTSVKSLYIYFNNMNIDHFDFSYLPIPGYDGVDTDFTLFVKASQINDIQRYINSYGAIRPDILLEVKKKKLKFIVPSWSVYTYLEDVHYPLKKPY